MIYKTLRNKNFILVDYFDTVVFRDIHSRQVLPQWAKVMAYHYRDSIKKSAEEWLALRFAAISSVKGYSGEISYDIVMSELWKKIDVNIEKKEFIDTCLEMDIAVELGCQYPDFRMVNLLRNAKRQGEKDNSCV